MREGCNAWGSHCMESLRVDVKMERSHCIGTALRGSRSVQGSRCEEIAGGGSRNVKLAELVS